MPVESLLQSTVAATISRSVQLQHYQMVEPRHDILEGRSIS